MDIIIENVSPWEIQFTVINLNPNEYSQERHYYSFTVKLNRCVGSCNTLNELSNKVCVSNKTEELNLSVLNVITAMSESKILTKHTSCKCKCKFDQKNVIQIKSGIMVNVNVSVKTLYV